MGNRHTARLSAAALAAVIAISACSGGDKDSSHKSGSASGGVSQSGSGSGGGSGPGKKSGGPVGSVTIAAGGDDIPHPVMNVRAHALAGGNGYAYDSWFAPIKDYVSGADVAICQMETPLTSTDTDLSRPLSFNGPHEFAEAIKRVGYDGCSTANNHTFDRRMSGVRSTEQVMNKVGLQMSGPSSNSGDPQHVAWYSAKGFRIAQLSYSYTLDNFAGGSMTAPPAGAPWFTKSLWAVRTASGIAQDARAARAKGADIVVVSLHWGTQYMFTPDSGQETLANALAKTNSVDWVIGNHPHVIQECRRIGSTMVNFSLGNQISEQGSNIVLSSGPLPDGTQDGVVVKVTFTRDSSGKVTTKEQYLPTRIDRTGGNYTIRPVTQSSNPTSWNRTTGLLKGKSNSCQVSAAN